MPRKVVVEELTVQTSGISAESTADGAVANAVPKEGGNTFTGSISGLFTNHDLQSSNFNEALRARGLPDVNKTLEVYDASVSLGGRIRKDKLWFFVAFREWGNRNQDAGTFWNKTQGAPLYTPDSARPGDRGKIFR